MLTIAYYLLLELQNCEWGAGRERVSFLLKRMGERQVGGKGRKTTKYCRSNETRLLAIDYNGVDVFGYKL